MQWASPGYVWLVVPVTLLFLYDYQAGRRRFNTARLLTRTGCIPQRTFAATALIRLTSAFLLVAALCRPQWGSLHEQQETRGFDIIIALDTSRSMLARDVFPDRLSAARRAIANLVQQLRGERIGLIAFAGTAFPVCPLTSDYADFLTMLDETGIDSIPHGGSNLAGFHTEVLNAFKGTSPKSRLLILVSDGEDHGGRTAEAARALRESGLEICCVTAGSEKGAIIPLPAGDFVKDRDGTIVTSHADPGTLALFSRQSLRLDAGGTALSVLYEQVRPRLQQRRQVSSHHREIERFQFPLAAALLLLALETAPAVRRRS